MFIELKKQELLATNNDSLKYFYSFSLKNPEIGITVCTCKKESSWTDKFFHYRISPRKA